MASSSEEGGMRKTASFFGLDSTYEPNITPPEALREKMNRYRRYGGADKSLKPDATAKVTNEKDYVEKYRRAEQTKVNNLRGRGGTRVRGGGGRTQPPGSVSVYGTVAEKRLTDVEVYLKYDFSRRMFDTSDLAINTVRAKILAHLSNSQVMIVEGSTGCGKSTQVPQFILDDAVDKSANCNIIVTQPRRIAAISVANRVGHERNWKVGGIVGYQVGMDRCTTDDSRITYVTTGVLLQKLLNHKSLTQWTHIIIDEVHERDLDTDLLLLVIKKIMIDTDDTKTKIMLMSATLDAKKFAGYFPFWGEGNEGCFAVNADGKLPKRFPIEEHYLDRFTDKPGFDDILSEPMEDPKMYERCVKLAANIIDDLDKKERAVATGDPGAVLVFLPGIHEIETFYKRLIDKSFERNHGDASKLKWLILPLHSSITNEEQQCVFVPAQKGFRKIILATNIAESSITVSDIKYVIDFCLTKSLSCDTVTNYTCLRLEWASKNQCIQRRGRCGRVSSGVVYRMITKRFYKHKLDQETTPEMLKSNLESVVLQVKMLDMGPPVAVLALAVDPPNKSLIARAVANLKEIGALTVKAENAFDDYDGDLTFVGKVLSKLPIDIRLGRLILLGNVFGCLEEAVVIAAGLSVKTPFAYPYSKRMEAYLSKINWSKQSFSDCIALVNLYKDWHHRHQQRDFNGFSEEKVWARKNFVQIISLREMRVLIAELYKRLHTCDIVLTPTSYDPAEQLFLLKIVIAGAFYPNYFSTSVANLKDYQRQISRDLFDNDPFTSVVLQGFPQDQPGELYKNDIAKKLAHRNIAPKITFYGTSKLVATFGSRGDALLGPICQGVYRCVKLRQLGIRVEFPIYSPHNARSLLNKLKNNLHVPKIPCPSQIQVTSYQPRLKAVVTYIDSPAEFYVRRQSDDPVVTLIKQGLTNSRSSHEAMKTEWCKPGQCCIGYVQGKYHRVKIESEYNIDDQIMVYMIDIGKNVWIRRKYLFTLSQDVAENEWFAKPALAIKCRLQGIRTLVTNNGAWSPEAVEFFNEYCSRSNNLVTLIIHSIAEYVIAEVRNSDDASAPSINDLLVENKYAEKSESKNDYGGKQGKESVGDSRSGGYSTGMLEPKEVFKRPNYFDEATLRGPDSPLEMKFQSLCQSAHMKLVVNDGNSVNSVALDQDPTNPSSRVLISASVAIAERSGNMMARETTLMPPIPGLCGLLTMLFAPQVEFRVDKEYSMYTGCLSGLGIDPNTKYVVYKDHDMEHVFDTVIDNEDVSVVNSIRSGMNTVMSDSISSDEVRNLRLKMRDETLRLLNRKRERMEEQFPDPDDTHQWNLLDKGRVQVSNPERDGANVFPLHNHVLLKVQDGYSSSDQRSSSNISYRTDDTTSQEGDFPE